MNKSDRLFPVLKNDGRKEMLYFVPWDLVEKHNKQVMDNHDQTVERLAERGGLCIEELAAIFRDSSFDRNLGYEDALVIVFNSLMRFCILEL